MLTKKVWLIKDYILTPLAEGTCQHFEKIKFGYSAVKPESQFGIYPISYFTKLRDSALSQESRFEILLRLLLEKSEISKMNFNKKETLLILSTTKGNIELLESLNSDNPRLQLSNILENISSVSGYKNCKIVSNACISGVMSLIVAQRLLEAGLYKHAIIIGADVISEFIYKGFQCLNAMSPEICKPFDNIRNGINLGEGAALMLISTQPEISDNKAKIFFTGGALSNDANHISGPSRTGEPLHHAIQQSMQSSNLSSDNIDFICAHGTATMFNDEMEANAFALSNLSNCPTFSVKGNIGHTLGAAGVIEMILTAQCLRENCLIPSFGYSVKGVSADIQVSKNTVYKPLHKALKTASGFGGCNASIIIQKEKQV